MTRPRIAALILSMSLPVVACGGDDAATSNPVTDEAAGTETTTNAAPSAGPTIEEWAASVAVAVDAEVVEWQAARSRLQEEFDPELAIRWFGTACRAQAELTQRYDDTMPEPYGAPNADALYSTYLDTRAAYTAAAVDFCEAAEGQIDSGGSETQSDTDFELAADTLDLAHEQLISACFPLQELFAESLGLADPLLNCLGVERAFPDIGPGPDLEQGALVFDEISTPFRLDHDLPLDVDQFGDWVWLTNANGFTIEFWAVNEVADPTNRGSYEGGSSIPAPRSLDAWVEEMPIIVIERNETRVAGIEAKRWVMELDIEQIEGQTVARLWNLDSDAAPVLEAFDGEAPQRIVWEIPHPDGELLLITMLLDGPPEMIDWAESIVEDVTIP